MSAEGQAAVCGPEEPARTPSTATGGQREAWTGPTYYGRPALKEAPFNNWVVGGYVFLAGLSGASAILGLIADSRHGDAAEHAVRRARYLPPLASAIGAGLLVYDLHTPKRFYNMMRVAKGTSPMSIGTWILSVFSVFSGLTAGLQLLADRVPGSGWARRAAGLTNVPAALAGAGMSTYTGALLAATSTPLWAAAPAALAARFGAASMASGAAALSLAEAPGPTRSALDTIAVAALAAELAAKAVSDAAYRRAGVDGALENGWGAAEKAGATGLGIALPIALHLLSATGGGRGSLSRLASFAILGGSFLLRVSIMEAGNVSARTPEISFRFAQPDNLPRPRRRPTRRLQRT